MITKKTHPPPKKQKKNKAEFEMLENDPTIYYAGRLKLEAPHQALD